MWARDGTFPPAWRSPTSDPRWTPEPEEPPRPMQRAAPRQTSCVRRPSPSGRRKSTAAAVAARAAAEEEGSCCTPQQGGVRVETEEEAAAAAAHMRARQSRIRRARTGGRWPVDGEDDAPPSQLLPPMPPNASAREASLARARTPSVSASRRGSTSKVCVQHSGLVVSGLLLRPPFGRLRPQRPQIASAHRRATPPTAARLAARALTVVLLRSSARQAACGLATAPSRRRGAAPRRTLGGRPSPAARERGRPREGTGQALHAASPAIMTLITRSTSTRENAVRCRERAACASARLSVRATRRTYL